MDHDHRTIEIYQKIVELLDEGRRFAAAVVLSADGSTPQKVGARALIDATGKILFGTVGGGWVEGQAQSRAIDVCRASQATVLELRLENVALAETSDTQSSRPICGGNMRILLDPTVAKHRPCYSAAAQAIHQRQRGLLLSKIAGGEPTDVTLQWLPEDALASYNGVPGREAIGSCLSREAPHLFANQSPSAEVVAEVFVEPVVPRPLLLVAGGGHVGQALALQAVQIGFDVTVVDDRPEFANQALFPNGVAVQCGPLAQEVAALAGTPGVYVVIVTRGHQHDAETLAACIHAPAAYIGMIGSRRKVAMIREDLLRRGVASQAELDRVFAPIGLKIGAVTVPEIATSIAAQLIAVRREAVGSAQ